MSDTRNFKYKTFVQMVAAADEVRTKNALGEK